jgi:hypothetical protein
MRSIKFDQLGRKAPSLETQAAALAAGPSLAQTPLTDPGAVRPKTPVPRPTSESDAVVSAGSPKP